MVGYNKVYATTDGGILSFDIFNEQFSFIGFNEGLYPLDLKSISESSTGHLIVGSSINGTIQKINLIGN